MKTSRRWKAATKQCQQAIDTLPAHTRPWLIESLRLKLDRGRVLNKGLTNRHFAFVGESGIGFPLGESAPLYYKVLLQCQFVLNNLPNEDQIKVLDAISLTNYDALSPSTSKP